MTLHEELLKQIKHHGELSAELMETAKAVDKLIRELSDGDVIVAMLDEHMRSRLHFCTIEGKNFIRLKNLLGRPHMHAYAVSDEFIHLHFNVENTPCLTLINKDSEHLIKED